jgi:hypothetical protein
MAITLNCTCGKEYNFEDDAVGTTLKCECGQQLHISKSVSPAMIAQSTTVASVPSNSSHMTCRGCGGRIPAMSSSCQFCGAQVVAQLNKDESASVLDQMRAQIDAHLNDADALEADARMKGGTLTVKTMVLMALALFGFVLCFTDAIGFGVILILIFAIPVIVSWTNDRKCSRIQTAENAADALKYYLTAIRTGRYHKAFPCLAPPARKVESVNTIKFKADIPAHGGGYSIEDLGTFTEFWKSIFTGPSGQSRTVAVKKFRVLKQKGDLALVEAELDVTNYPSMLLLTIFLGVLVCALLILVIQKRESRRITKLLIKRDSLWFIADGSLEGTVDAMSVD